jgi:hypothetical protein
MSSTVYDQTTINKLLELLRVPEEWEYATNGHFGTAIGSQKGLSSDLATKLSLTGTSIIIHACGPDGSLKSQSLAASLFGHTRPVHNVSIYTKPFVCVATVNAGAVDEEARSSATNIWNKYSEYSRAEFYTLDLDHLGEHHAAAQVARAFRGRISLEIVPSELQRLSELESKPSIHFVQAADFATALELKNLLSTLEGVTVLTLE